MCLGALALCATTAVGCAGWQVPRIDPSGNRIFIWEPATSTTAPTPTVPAVVAPNVIPPGTPPSVPPQADSSAMPSEPTVANRPVVRRPIGDQLAAGAPLAIAVSPSQLVAPVGSQVVLHAGVVGAERRLLPGVPVGWTLSPESVGQFIQAEQAAGAIGATAQLGVSQPTSPQLGKVAVSTTTQSAARQNRLGRDLAAKDCHGTTG